MFILLTIGSSYIKSKSTNYNSLSKYFIYFAQLRILLDYYPWWNAFLSFAFHFLRYHLHWAIYLCILRFITYNCVIWQNLVMDKHLFYYHKSYTSPWPPKVSESPQWTIPYPVLYKGCQTNILYHYVSCLVLLISHR